MPSSPVVSDAVVLHRQSSQDLFLTHRFGAPDGAVERSPVTRFHITGFARFFNVPVNPSELIVNALPDYLAHHPLSHCAHLVSTHVLEVAAKGAVDQLKCMYASLPTKREHMKLSISANSLTNTHNLLHRSVFIHLGVNMSSSIFTLECQARNEATFSCADERGWRPVRCPIESDVDDITATRYTSLDLPDLKHKLHEYGFPVELSSDAGRFVCNWTYYNSLMLAKQHQAHALFVHVPPTSIVPIERQIEFVVALLDCISLSMP